ncbi:unnamed protein product [Absidia cylindrospora]
MTDLPLEIIDHILTFVDASSLYELGYVSHVLQFLSKKHLFQNHIQYVSIRLWTHQPGTMAHTPIDFAQPSSSFFDPLTPLTAQFTFTNQTIRFDPKKPVYVDGCTIIIHPNPNQPSRQHYGITYQQPALMKNSIISSSSSSFWTMEKQGQWSMHGELAQDGLFKPSSMSCSLDLFNPTWLDAVLQQQTIRLQERIKSKRLQQSTRGSMTIADLASSSTSSKESCSAKSLSVMPSSSPARSKYFTSLFTSISS